MSRACHLHDRSLCYELCSVFHMKIPVIPNLASQFPYATAEDTLQSFLAVESQVHGAEVSVIRRELPITAI